MASPALSFPEVIPTRRLSLRLPVPADAPVIFETYSADSAVSRFLAWRPHRSVDEAATFLAACPADRERGSRYAYMLDMRDKPGAPIGMIEARIRAHTAELGYVLARSRWGQGLMTEACEALTTWALGVSGIFRVQALCDAGNPASARVLEKCGFTMEGRLERYAVHPNVSSDPRACLMYARWR